MATIVEHPLFALGEIRNNMEANPRRNSVEIIDVDAHDEPPASSSLLSQVPPRPRPSLRPRNSFHPDAIISLVDDSDDEVQILSNPIPGRHSYVVVYCFLLIEFCQAVDRERPIAAASDLRHCILLCLLLLLQFHPYPVDMPVSPQCLQGEVRHHRFPHFQ